MRRTGGGRLTALGQKQGHASSLNISDVGHMMQSWKKEKDDLEAENARLQERVKELEKHDCGYALQRTLEIAERQMALAKVRGEALEKRGCSYNRQYPCVTSLKDYPAEWCLRCRAIALTPEAALTREQSTPH